MNWIHCKDQPPPKDRVITRWSRILDEPITAKWWVEGDEWWDGEHFEHKESDFLPYWMEITRPEERQV